MTRINLLPPEELHDRHLVAEYRELPRLFSLIRAWQARPRREPLPATYRLGQGHVLFFYNKAPWLLARQRALIAEMRRRDMQPRFEAEATLLDGIDLTQCLVHWEPTPEEVALNRARITARLAEMAARRASGRS